MSKKTDTLLWMGITIVLCLLAIVFYKNYSRDATTLIESFGLAGPLVCVAIFSILSVTPIPTDPLAVVVATLFHPFLAVTILWTGNTSAALLEYRFGKTLRNITAYEEKKHALPWGLARMPIGSVWVLTLGRMIPGYGSKVIAILAGVYGVNRWRFFWTTALINLGGALMYTVGSQFLKVLF